MILTIASMAAGNTKLAVRIVLGPALLCIVVLQGCRCLPTSQAPIPEDGPAPASTGAQPDAGVSRMGTPGPTAAPGTAPSTRGSHAAGARVPADTRAGTEGGAEAKPLPCATSSPEALVRALLDALAAGDPARVEPLFITEDEIAALFSEQARGHHAEGLAQLRSRLATMTLEPWPELKVLGLSGGTRHQVMAGELGCRGDMLVWRGVHVSLDSTLKRRPALVIEQMVRVEGRWRLVAL